MLKSICNKLQRYKSECLHWSDSASDDYYNDFVEINPDDHCSMNGMCSAVLNHELNTILLENSMLSYDNIDGNPMPECNLCEKVIKRAQKEIGSDKSRVIHLHLLIFFELTRI